MKKTERIALVERLWRAHVWTEIAVVGKALKVNVHIKCQCQLRVPLFKTPIARRLLPGNPIVF